MNRLVQLTPEGKIALALVEGSKTYTELKRFTRLSDRWLSRKLAELMETETIELRNGKYCLIKTSIIASDPLAFEFFKSAVTPLAKARSISDELGRNPKVLAVVLFGSVAKGRMSEESDLDFLIITNGESELNEEVYELMFKYDVPIEAFFMSYEELLSHVQMKSTFLLGVLEGYRVLFDRAGVEHILSFLDGEVREEFVYSEEAGAWIRRSAPLISTAP